MFARNVSLLLKPDTLKDFTTTFQKEIIPMLRKQSGFQDEMAIAAADGRNVTAVSLWDSEAQSEIYATTTYLAVLEILQRFLESPPKVRAWSVVSFTVAETNHSSTTSRN